jgi:hypothetical protein
LIVLGAALVGDRAVLAPAASAAPARVSTLVRAIAPGQLPPVARWVDPTDQTAYALLLSAQDRRQPGQFVFDLPSGNQLSGYVPLTQQPDGSYVQQSSSAAGACVTGQLTLAQPKPGQIPVPSPKTAPTSPVPAPSAVVLHLQARLDPHALVVYVGISYAAQSDSQGVNRVCTQAPVDYQVLSGCTFTNCTAPLDTAVPRASKHGSAVITATRTGASGDWQAVYNLTAHDLTGQYDANSFAAALNEQVSRKGHITSISPISSPPTVQYDAAGQAYFEVTQTVTLERNGTTTTQQVTSYYLLEGGQWLFWFST